jgi:SAM-dependent MidA family methyltransferase
MPRPILPEPPDELKQLSEALSARIREEIRRDGNIPFSRYMGRALYEPGLGYYSAGLHKLGASGDFVTAPELGGLFAACLARQVAEVAAELGPFDVLEVGAGSGRLAADLLRELAHGEPGRRGLPDRYLILETSADLRRVQRERIVESAPAWLDRVSWLDEPPAAGWNGVLIANEVIDALPVERFRATGPAIEQLCVAEQDSGFGWAGRPAPADLDSAVRRLETDLGRTFPAGYRSEIHLQLPAWLALLTREMARRCAITVTRPMTMCSSGPACRTLPPGSILRRSRRRPTPVASRSSAMPTRPCSYWAAGWTACSPRAARAWRTAAWR